MLFKGGVEVLRLVFNGHLSNELDWFSQRRLAFSPYTDLKTSPFNYFSIRGYLTRHFYINKIWNGCPNDAGWLIYYTPGIVCPWETRNDYKIKYSRSSTVENFTTGMQLIIDNLFV